MNVNFNDYNRLYPEQISQKEFVSLLPLATAFINAITANRAEAATGYKEERAELALIAVIHEMSTQNAARGISGARVNSVSNDGYSESYGSNSSAEGEEKALRCAAFRYLSGTGLMGAL